MSEPFTVQDENLSLAWTRSVKQMTNHKEITPLVVIVTGFENGRPIETPEIRMLLDQKYVEFDIDRTCHSVANTIFPNSIWHENSDRNQLFERYMRMLPRLRKYKGNRYGLYFERMISYGKLGNSTEGLNQLERIIDNWQRGIHRPSALQAHIFYPQKDLAPQIRRGFPCLDHVSFAPQGQDGLSITGYYTYQTIFTRAYGNYLGLCNLGRFMAHEMGRNLTQMTCIANIERRDAPVSVLRQLIDQIDRLTQR